MCERDRADNIRPRCTASEADVAEAKQVIPVAGEARLTHAKDRSSEVGPDRRWSKTRSGLSVLTKLLTSTGSSR